MTASTKTHGHALDRWKAWSSLYVEMHKVASSLLAVCPTEHYSAMLAAVKAVEAKANEESKR